MLVAWPVPPPTTSPAVRSKLNQVETKANYYIEHIYILKRLSMRITHVDYGDCSVKYKDGESKDYTWYETGK
jgi:hypothetical protein